jgi:hypothetical protein
MAKQSLVISREHFCKHGYLCPIHRDVKLARAICRKNAPIFASSLWLTAEFMFARSLPIQRAPSSTLFGACEYHILVTPRNIKRRVSCNGYWSRNGRQQVSWTFFYFMFPFSALLLLR